MIRSRREPMTRSVVLTFGACMALLLAGCDGLDLMVPGAPLGGDAELVSDGVRVTLTVSPAAVTPTGTVLARLRYENTTSSTRNVTSGYGCLSFASVYRGNTRIPFPATDYACITVVTNRELPPGGAIGMEWPLHIGSDGVALAPGEYRFVAELNTHDRNLERTFVVR
jgi:hypothetical protein